MAPVVLDTDVASLIIKGRLSSSLAGKITGMQSAVTFVTRGELTKWSVMRNWGAPRRADLERWIAARAPIPVTDDVARTWGEISAYAVKRGRPRPINDTWIAACCLTFDLPLATLNLGDFQDFVDHEGLVLITA
jgi:predicted nucleic acid-binding protein